MRYKQVFKLSFFFLAISVVYTYLLPIFREPPSDYVKTSYKVTQVSEEVEIIRANFMNSTDYLLREDSFSVSPNNKYVSFNYHNEKLNERGLLVLEFLPISHKTPEIVYKYVNNKNSDSKLAAAFDMGESFYTSVWFSDDELFIVTQGNLQLVDIGGQILKNIDSEVVVAKLMSRSLENFNPELSSDKRFLIYSKFDHGFFGYENIYNLYTKEIILDLETMNSVTLYRPDSLDFRRALIDLFGYSLADRHLLLSFQESINSTTYVRRNRRIDLSEFTSEVSF